MSLVSIGHNPYDDYDYPAQLRQFVEDFIKSNSASSRNWIVFCSRNSVCGEERQTLQEIGSRCGVTRERIRQIEIKITRRLQRKFEIYFVYNNNNVDIIKQKYTHLIANEIFGDCKFVSIFRLQSNLKTFPSWLKTFILIVSDLHINGFMDLFFDYCEFYGGWVRNDFNELNISNSPECSDIHDAIQNSIEAESWPISINAIMTKLNMPIDIIIDYILANENKYNLEKKGVNYYINFKKLPMKKRLIYLIRKAKSSLSIEQIRIEHKKWFGKSISVGQVTSTLGAMDSALIVGRREYNIYENLSLDSSQLKLVRDFAETFLLHRNEYVSAKIIFLHLKNELFFSSDFKSVINNGYILLGILQDDPRFNCQRGFMVGLLAGEFEGTYNSLQHEIFELIKSHKRPMTISEIIDHFADRRELINPSVQGMLNSCGLFECVDVNKYTLKDSTFHEQELSSSLEEDALFLDW